MPRYSNYGSLDNLMVDEGDVAFTKVNARLRQIGRASCRERV